MSEEIKGNDAIGADQAAFMAALDRAREVLGRLEGVAGVGFGHKEVAGEFSFDVVIQVFVREKKADEALAPEQRIPPTFEGYRTDVRTMPSSVPTICRNLEKYATIRGGITIEAWRKVQLPGVHWPGTMGCLVRKRGDESRENWHLLTNEHVLFKHGGDVGNAVYHPLAPVGGAADTVGRRIATIREGGVRGRIKAYVPLSPTQPLDPLAPIPPLPTEPVWQDDFYVDCAIAQLEIDSMCCGMVCDMDRVVYDTSIPRSFLPASVNSPPQDPTNNGGRIAGVRSVARDLSICLPGPTSASSASPNFPKVFKTGYRTGLTAGYVRSVMLPATTIGLEAEPNVMEIEFASPYLGAAINDCGKKAFTDSGDSGSVVLDKDNNIIGLVYAKERVPGLTDEQIAALDEDPRPGWRSYACHILPVLDALRICVPTTGVGHFGKTYGTTWATDGSGLSSQKTPSAAELPRPNASVRTQAATVASAAPTPGQRARIDRFHEALLATDEGRALDELMGRHRSELLHLVRRVRPVTVTWHRYKGPAFLAQAIAHLRGESETLPREVGGVARDALLARMREVLAAHGSPALRRTLAEHGDALRALLADADTIDDLLAVLRRTAAETPAHEHADSTP